MTLKANGIFVSSTPWLTFTSSQIAPTLKILSKTPSHENNYIVKGSSIVKTYVKPWTIEKALYQDFYFEVDLTLDACLKAGITVSNILDLVYGLKKPTATTTF